MTAIATSEAGVEPHRIGPYQVLYEIGRGGMGVVYRAVHVDGGPQVALKVPSRDLADLFGCMRREIHALGRLRHPGIVRIIEEGVEKGVPWYAMELLEARSLDMLLNLPQQQSDYTEVLPFESYAQSVAVRHSKTARAPVRGDLGRALTLMYRLARVLAYVHAHGIVHRDLKPQNILIRAGDRPVLVDFGVMGQFRAQGGREVLEVGGLMMGTAIYAAPEQANGELVDARADLYSFGVMLYQIVCNEPPFIGRSVHSVVRQHLTVPPVPPSSLIEGVSPVLEKLILNLLEKRRSARLGYAEDVAEMLVEAGAEPDADFKVDTAAYLYRPEIVGRKATLEALHARIPEVRDGAGTLVLLGGESGIGKTSVAAAFTRAATIARFEVITAECDPVGGQPLHPLRPLLRAIADFCRGNAVAMERILGPRLAVLREQEPALAALAGDATPRLAPEIVSRRLFTDLAETLAAFARETPLLLVLDDLQWADEITLRFLTSLGPDYFAGVPLMIVGTYRVDEAGPELRALIANRHVNNVVLSRLDDDNVGDIVRSMLAAPDAPPKFLQFLTAQTEGNPFFVAEYLRAAVDERLLVRERGRWRVTAEDERYASLGLPGTLRDLVARRIDALSPLAQRVAETAAVLGREVPESLLIAACGESEIEALEAISELIERHVFEEAGDGVRFAHDKLREGSYARIAGERRRALHARAAELIEADCASEERLRRHAAVLAHHCDMAGQHEKAIGYYAQAAESAVGSGACREAVDLMNRALSLDEPRAAKEPARPRAYRHARWHRVLSFAHFGLGDLRASGEHAEQSLAEVGIRVPHSRPGWRMRLGTETLRQAAHFLVPPRLFRPSGVKQARLREIAMAAQKFSEGKYYADDNTLMLASALLAMNVAERLGDAPGLIHTYAQMGGAVTSGLGMHRLAAHYFDKARALSIATNDLSGLGHVGYVSAILYITTCDWKSCERHFDAALAAAKETGDHQIIEMNEMARGLFEMYQGRLGEAVAAFSGMRDRAHKRSNRQHEAWGHSWRAINLILKDRIPEALEALDLALRLLPGQLVPHAHRCHALLHQGKLDEALEAADVTADMVAKIGSIIWEKYRGLSAPAEVYLEALRRRDDEAMRRQVQTLLKRLEGVSRRILLALPVSLRLQGVLELVDGNPRRGEKLLRKSIAAAVRLGLPLDEGIGEYELMRHTRVPSERARTIFETIGCDLYLRKWNEFKGA
ncbi:MAG TPA: AAA family ATPase [Thermoanaerobaculia bacterium]